MAAHAVRSSIFAAAAASAPTSLTSAAANSLVMEHLIKSAATHRFHQEQQQKLAAVASALPSWLLATVASEQALHGLHPLESAFRTPSLFR